MFQFLSKNDLNPGSVCTHVEIDMLISKEGHNTYPFKCILIALLIKLFDINKGINSVCLHVI